MSLVDTIKVVKGLLNPNHIKFAVSYLKKYGYLREDFTLNDFVAAVVKFHQYFHIKSEELTLESITAMAGIRCGCPDNEHIVEDATQAPKWGRKTLSYYVDSYVNGLTKEKQGEIYQRAYDSISKVCGLTFVRVNSSSSAQIVITTSNSRKDELGTPSGVLAFAELPPSNNFDGQLEMTIDLAETWIDNPTNRGILLQNVFCHESGHNLGLTHSKIQGALMAPYYNAAIAVPQQQDDVTRLQALYGKGVVTTPTPIPTEPEDLVIRIKGSVKELAIDGYRVSKLG